ncbi:hypothetical protein HC928_13465 [bacterium]|nr:hypothetical protein [bacterium]
MVEIDEVNFETVIPNSELRFSGGRTDSVSSPESLNHLNRVPSFAGREPDLIQLGIKIRNGTSIPLYFSNYETLVPEMIDSEGEKVHVGTHVDGICFPKKSNYLLVAPQESIKIFPLSALLRNENGLEICIYSETGMFFLLYCLQKNFLRNPTSNLTPGRYTFRFSYTNRYPRDLSELNGKPYSGSRLIRHMINLESSLSEKVWRGTAHTPFQNVYLC